VKKKKHRKKQSKIDFFFALFFSNNRGEPRLDVNWCVAGKRAPGHVSTGALLANGHLGAKQKVREQR
jgi:hypothetical protein